MCGQIFTVVFTLIIAYHFLEVKHKFDFFRFEDMSFLAFFTPFEFEYPVS